jgi:hypothetical protein
MGQAVSWTAVRESKDGNKIYVSFRMESLPREVKKEVSWLWKNHKDALKADEFTMFLRDPMAQKQDWWVYWFCDNTEVMREIDEHTNLRKWETKLAGLCAKWNQVVKNKNLEQTKQQVDVQTLKAMHS